MANNCQLERAVWSTSDTPPPSIHHHSLSDRMSYHFQEYQQLFTAKCPGTLPCCQANGKANRLATRRPLGQLFTSKDILTGEEAEKLRKYCNDVYLNPDKDLKDPYGLLFEGGSLTALQEHFQSRVQHFEGRRHEAAQELFRLRWGPARDPVYVVLLLWITINPGLRDKYFAIAKWLVDSAKVPVDGMYQGMPLHGFVRCECLVNSWLYSKINT